MKTLLIGNFGAKNLGDELILNFAIEKIGAKNCVVMTADCDFSQKFCGRNFETIPVFPTGFCSFFQFFLNKNHRKKILLAKSADRVVFPGGGLFAIKFRAFFLWFLIFLWVKFLVKKPIFFENQGVDFPRNFIEKWILKFVFSRTESISVRDFESSEALKKCGIDAKIVADRVFENLKFEKTEKQKISLWNSRADVDFFGQEGVFLAMEPGDLDFARNFCGKSVFPQTKSELFSLFSVAERAIGERLHFLILGVKFCGSEKTFCLRKPYSQKVASFCEKNEVKVFSAKNFGSNDNVSKK